MKRGCTVSMVHFHSMPYTARRSVDQVRDIARLLTTYQFRTKLFIVPFAPVQNEIVRSTEQSLRVILYRRMMLRIAERIARREDAEGLVTGEAVGQVASQTLRNIRVIDSAATLPVLRPLSGSDKEEILATARTIGTHDISAEPYDDCCSFLAPRNPQTWAEPGPVAEAETHLDIPALVDTAVRSMESEKFSYPPDAPADRGGEGAGHGAAGSVPEPSGHA
jgi:thiamine biosynthesis protein ThiI